MKILRKKCSSIPYHPYTKKCDRLLKEKNVTVAYRSPGTLKNVLGNPKVWKI